MIFTSYFAKLRNMPDNFHPIAICQYPPKWYDGPVYKNLAPTWDILNEYKKSSLSEEEKDERYTNRFNKEILSKITDPQKILSDLEYLSRVKSSESEHIVLLCFEKSSDFCHRSIVADFLTKQGIPVREATDVDFETLGINCDDYEK